MSNHFGQTTKNNFFTPSISFRRSGCSDRLAVVFEGPTAATGLIPIRAPDGNTGALRVVGVKNTFGQQPTPERIIVPAVLATRHNRTWFQI
jgi:hypothetical protein